MQIIEKPGIGTLYAFRGPRSHRLVSLLVPSPDWQRHQEQLALQKASIRQAADAAIDEILSDVAVSRQRPHDFRPARREQSN